MPRTHQSHLENLATINNIRNPKTVHHKGVKSGNCLEELLYFNVTDCLPLDFMHDFLEGML